VQQSDTPHRPRGPEVIRHRVRTRLAGRARFVVPAAVALIGLALTGVSAAVSSGGDDGAPTELAAVAANQQARTDAAERADRAQRAAPSPSATTQAPSKAATPAAPKAAATTKAAPKPAWVSPMPGAGTTSCFGMRWGVLHAGIDLAADAGTPIHAAGAGTVIGAGWLYTGYGISVVIDHGNGYLTHYAHQSRVAVQAGQKVVAGQLIGYEGSTGDSTGPHLHFEVHQGLWNQIDPAPWMRARGVNLGC
jgi:murein DD-endopeptidase MepM/ murein hydrolase activator NlpD